MRLLTNVSLSVAALLSFTAASAFTSGSASAAKRVALVMCNSSYTGTGSVKDCKDVGERLANSLYAYDLEVVNATDANRAAMETQIKEFQQLSRNADLAVVYYFGMGAHDANGSYLMPTDASGNPASAGYKVQDLIEHLSKNAAKSLVVLDAFADSSIRMTVSEPQTSSWSQGLGLGSLNGVDNKISVLYDTVMIGGERSQPSTWLSNFMIERLAGTDGNRVQRGNKVELTRVAALVKEDQMIESNRQQMPWMRGGMPPAAIQMMHQLDKAPVERRLAEIDRHVRSKCSVSEATGDARQSRLQDVLDQYAEDKKVAKVDVASVDVNFLERVLRDFFGGTSFCPTQKSVKLQEDTPKKVVPKRETKTESDSSKREAKKTETDSPKREAKKTESESPKREVRKTESESSKREARNDSDSSRRETRRSESAPQREASAPRATTTSVPRVPAF